MTADTYLAIMEDTTFVQILYAVLTLASACGIAKVLFDLANRGAMKRPPAAMSYPWIGELFEFTTDPIGLQRRRHKQFGSVYRFTMMGQTYIQVGNPQSIRRLLASEDKLVQAATPLSFEMMLGSGSLASVHGDEHTSLRKVVVPAFTQKAIVNYLPNLVKTFSGFLDDWIKRGHIIAHDEITTATFRIAVEVILGFDEKLWFNEKEQHTVLLAWRDFLQGLFAAPFWFLKYIPGTGLHTGLKSRRYLSELIGQSLDIIQKQIDSGVIKSEPDSANVGQTILTQTDDNGNHISRSQAIDLSINILFAGHETTAKALLMLLRCLKQEPKNIELLLEEQKQVIAKHGPELTETAIKDMTFLDANAKEIMRHYPIVTAVIRDAKQDFELDGFQIRKGDMLWLGLRRSMQEVSPFWKDDTEFPVLEYRPKRWLSEQGATASLLSFGSGARLCPGQNLAFMEFKVLTSLMLRRCDWDVDLNEKLVPFPIITPINGMPMTLTPKDPPLPSPES